MSGARKNLSLCSQGFQFFNKHFAFLWEMPFDLFIFFGFFRGAPDTGHLWRFLPECGLGIKGDIRIRETGAQTVRMAVLVRVTCGIWPASGMMCKTVCWNGHCWATKFNFLMERYRRNLRVDTCYTPWTPQS